MKRFKDFLAQITRKTPVKKRQELRPPTPQERKKVIEVLKKRLPGAKVYHNELRYDGESIVTGEEPGQWYVETDDFKDYLVDVNKGTVKEVHY